MKKEIVVAAIAILVVGSCSNPVQRIEYGSGDEYGIYAAVLQGDSASSSYLLILRDSTYTSLVNIDSVRMAYIKNCIPSMLEGALTNFVAVNRNNVGMKHIPGVNNLEIAGDGQKLSGRDTVFITLSRVGYDNSRTQALLEVGESVGPLAGSGSLILLEKVDGRWQIKARCMTWIS
ncbi:MAG TPA: hypothetical protein VIS48_15215 [Candidatus Kryptonia bacterium]